MPVLSVDSDVKPHLNITVTTHDTELLAMLNTAEAAIAQRVGPLSASATTQRVRGGTTLVVDTLPTISLTSVTPVGGTALTVAELTIGRSGVIEYLDSDTTFGERWYDVVYSAGRSSLPSDLRLGILELVRHLWETQRGAANRGTPRSAETAPTPGAAYMFPNRVTELIAAHLQPGFA